MKIAKDGIRSIVKIGYDGRVHKTFRGTDRETAIPKRSPGAQSAGGTRL
jgi:hypothetical protein